MNNHKRKGLFWMFPVFALMVTVQLSCSLTQKDIYKISTSVSGTLTALPSETATFSPPVAPTFTVVAAIAETTVRATTTEEAANQQPPSTEPPTFTATSIPLVSVSVDTNCRTGPGIIYEYLGGLLIGEKAEVIAGDPTGYYWYIKNPDRAGFCWVAKDYATVVGDTSSLPVFTPIPTPTFTPTATSTSTPSVTPTITPTP